MGLSRCAIYIKNGTEMVARDFLVDVGLLPPGASSIGRVPNQDSIGEGQFGIAQEGNWTVIFSESAPYLEGLEVDKLQKLSKERDVFFWLTQGTSGGMWFECWKKGLICRKWIEVDGAVEENIGAELPEEPKGYFDSTSPEDGRDEWSLAELAGEITGVTDSRLFEMNYNVCSGGNG